MIAIKMMVSAEDVRKASLFLQALDFAYTHDLTCNKGPYKGDRSLEGRSLAASQLLRMVLGDQGVIITSNEEVTVGTPPQPRAEG